MLTVGGAVRRGGSGRDLWTAVHDRFAVVGVCDLTKSRTAHTPIVDGDDSPAEHDHPATIDESTELPAEEVAAALIEAAENGQRAYRIARGWPADDKRYERVSRQVGSTPSPFMDG